ncbi:hypothetical protein [Tumebacillus flagellatus]|uniref:Uncharacterized protein n=1 Tax=Tumebacillus flagellatus TaxID=1157490 RepID=A0A074LQY1_9BACL|nr:hypothetical protein [Tumebacillus flagellatus]KEO82223.1 hypothetical protein EL26_16360 [Tumebacillus flagellatus]
MNDNKSPHDPNFIGDHEPVPYDMTTAGDEDTTLWENMIQAFKPDLLHLNKHHNIKTKGDE